MCELTFLGASQRRCAAVNSKGAGVGGWRVQTGEGGLEEYTEVEESQSEHRGHFGEGLSTVGVGG